MATNESHASMMATNESHASLMATNESHASMMATNESHASLMATNESHASMMATHESHASLQVADTIWLEKDVVDEAQALLDPKQFESTFGLGETRGRSDTKDEASAAATPATPSRAKKETVQLIDPKRSNNIAIALARLRMSDEQVISDSL
jgi:hypothetical protein